MEDSNPQTIEPDQPLEKPAATTWKKVKRVLPWLITVVIFSYIFVYQVELGHVFEAALLVKLRIFLPTLIVVFLVGFAVDTLSLYLTINWMAAECGYLEVCVARGASHILGVINYSLGQGGMGFWLAKKKKVSAGIASGPIVFMMFMAGTMLLLLAAVGLTFLPGASWSEFFSGGKHAGIMRYVGVALSINILFIIAWVVKPKHRLLSFLFRGPLVAFKELRLKHFVIIFILYIITFATASLGYWIGLTALDVHIPLFRLITYLPIIWMIGALPITVMQLGTTQLAWIAFFGAIAPVESILAFSMLWSFTFVLLRSTIGIFCLPIAIKDYKKNK